jgi:hypothetical protein
MARTSRSKTTRNGATAPKAQRLGSTPDDIWQWNPEIMRRFLPIRRDYEQLCAEVEYILRKRIADRGIETSSILPVRRRSTVS